MEYLGNQLQLVSFAPVQVALSTNAAIPAGQTSLFDFLSVRFQQEKNVYTLLIEPQALPTVGGSNCVLAVNLDYPTLPFAIEGIFYFPNSVNPAVPKTTGIPFLIHAHSNNVTIVAGVSGPAVNTFPQWFFDKTLLQSKFGIDLLRKIAIKKYSVPLYNLNPMSILNWVNAGSLRNNTAQAGLNPLPAQTVYSLPLITKMHLLRFES